MLTKTDYLRYLEAPMHLWASKHDRCVDAEISSMDRHLMEQGMQVEQRARNFLTDRLAAEAPGAEVDFQRMVSEPGYSARLDAAVYNPAARAWDIYEIKSSSSVKKEHLIDAAFQRLVMEANYPLRHTFLVHINKDYRRAGEIDLAALFTVVNVDDETAELLPEVRAGRAEALKVMESQTEEGIPTCGKPAACPCPDLCHPDLPSPSIYDLPRINATRVEALLASGITAAAEIPEDFSLSAIQRRHAAVYRSGRPQMDREAVAAALAGMIYPLYFLDYETFNPALPWFDGYRPYQQMVFQYSLHIVNAPQSEPEHREYLAQDLTDPAPEISADLLANIGPVGSVVVWNKSFEAGRNRELGEMVPHLAGRMEDLNARIYDLMEVFSKGDYVHPDFRGSASIKVVLPVLVPDLDYSDLTIGKGDDAMLAWARMVQGGLSEEDADQTRQALLAYCQRDTLAMVRIWQNLRELAAA